MNSVKTENEEGEVELSGEKCKILRESRSKGKTPEAVSTTVLRFEPERRHKKTATANLLRVFVFLKLKRCNIPANLFEPFGCWERMASFKFPGAKSLPGYPVAYLVLT